MCGMGRTGSLFALEQEGIAADITTLAKGLGAGYQPIAALMAAENVIRIIKNGSGTLWNGHTYMSHAIATAGALAVQQVIEEENLLADVRTRGEQLRKGLQTRLSQNPHVGNIRGRGLFWTVELVQECTTKQPFDATLGLAPKVRKIALDLGLMCYPSQGCADGTQGDHVLLAPAYTSTRKEIETICDLITQAIETALAG